MKFINEIYLDKEKDIIIKLFEDKSDELTYILETPNHNTGNLITNLAKICNLDTIQDENNMKIIKGIIPAYINSNNEEVYILRLGGIKIANIYKDGRIDQKATISSIMKTLMSQTKDYKFGPDKTIIKSYLLKETKFRTDVHTHMNANLSPDILIALGISHQLKYPLYYIKKLNLKITPKQESMLISQREKVEKDFKDSKLKGKYLTRRIDDNTFINFADLILNNLDNAKENIEKIRVSLAILKDGQAVFTNLEKVYLYRYIFAKGIESEKKISLIKNKINRIPQKDIKNAIMQMLEDKKETSIYKNNNLRQDKLLWIAREYQKQGINYVEIADTTLTKKGLPAIELLEDIHEVMPKIEDETGVFIRFLVAIRRIPLTIIKDQITSDNYLRENLDVLKAVAKSPYVVGSDFIGEEINDISELQPVIKEIVQYAVTEDEGFTIRIHAGENDSLRDNILKSIQCVTASLRPGQNIPKIRIGHGVYTPNIDSKEGQHLIKVIKNSNAVMEFQLTSNVRLNNLSDIENHPIKKYLDNGIKCVQGTDGCGIYGTDTIDEQLALQNLLNLSSEDFKKMRDAEDEIIKNSTDYFKKNTIRFNKFLGNRTIRDAILEAENKNLKSNKRKIIKLKLNNKLFSEELLKNIIKEFPEDKIPIIIAGGSFNAQNKETIIDINGKRILENLIKKLDDKKVFFVIGHKLQAYEKLILDLSNKLNKHFEIYCIVPKMLKKENIKSLLTSNISGVRISTESEEFGIYKSFNYEIFERRPSIVIIFDGNAPALNLIQEAKNGKAKSKIYVNSEKDSLRYKAKTLRGYVTLFKLNENIEDNIIDDIKFFQ